MSRFGIYGKFTAHAGKRDALVQALLEAAAGLQSFEGCEVYIINVSETEPDVVWVTEVWRDQAAHQASLAIPGTKDLIQRTRPLIAGIEQTKLVPVGGKGLPE
jgi:quinol monooxygenase YgiN